MWLASHRHHPLRRKYGPQDELEAGGRYSEVVMAMIRVLRRDPDRLVEYEALLPADMQQRLYSKVSECLSR